MFITNTSYVDGGSENPLTSVCLALKHNFRIDQWNIRNGIIEKPIHTKYRRRIKWQTQFSFAFIENQSSVTNIESKVTINRDEKPINEFTGSNILILTAFPCLFMLGRGKQNKATLSTTFIRHMMFQFNNRIAECHRLILYYSINFKSML